MNTNDQDEIKAMSIGDLEKYIGDMGLGDDRGKYANVILQARTKQAIYDQVKELKKPHWLVLWGFIVAVITMILAAIAVYPIVVEMLEK